MHIFLILCAILEIMQRLSLRDCDIEAERQWEGEEEGSKRTHASLSPELFTETSVCVLVR